MKASEVHALAKKMGEQAEALQGKIPALEYTLMLHTAGKTPVIDIYAPAGKKDTYLGKLVVNPLEHLEKLYNKDEESAEMSVGDDITWLRLSLDKVKKWNEADNKSRSAKKRLTDAGKYIKAALKPYTNIFAFNVKTTEIIKQ